MSKIQKELGIALAVVGIIAGLVFFMIQYEQGIKNELVLEDIKNRIDSTTQQPIPVILKSKEPYYVGTPIEFTGELSNGFATFFIWNFGDGESEKNKTVNHTYQESGIYTISLTVFDDKNMTSTITEQITINSNTINDDVKSNNQSHTVSILKDSSNPKCEKNNSCYAPTSLSIQIHDTVIWINQDNVHHTITSGNPVDGPSGVFDSGLLLEGQTFEHTFLAKGIVEYSCIIHPWANGKIIVN